jgi:hypothetical protein
MTGAKGAEFAAMCDVALVSPHAVTPYIQEGHLVMGHAFCLIVERTMFPNGAPGAGPRPRRRGRTPRAASPNGTQSAATRPRRRAARARGRA